MSEDLYGEQYFAKFDGGLGYGDCPTWEDNAFLIKQTFGFDPEKGDIPLSVIDLGCAFGYLPRHLRRRGVEAFGTDISSYAIANAPEEIKPFVFQFDLSIGDIRDRVKSQFDLVVCFETLEHIPEGNQLELFVTNIYNLIKPGGFALLSICVEENPEHDDDDTHVTIKPRSWWRHRFEATGLVHVTTLERPFTDSLYYYKHNGVFVFGKPE